METIITIKLASLFRFFVKQEKKYIFCIFENSEIIVAQLNNNNLCQFFEQEIDICIYIWIKNFRLSILTMFFLINDWACVIKVTSETLHVFTSYCSSHSYNF